MSATIPCDFCPRVLERDQMEGIKVSTHMTDSDGDSIVGAQCYYFGHSDCIRAFYSRLSERKLKRLERPRSEREVQSPESESGSGVATRPDGLALD